MLANVTVEEAGKSRVLIGGLANSLHQRNLRALYEHMYGKFPLASADEYDEEYEENYGMSHEFALGVDLQERAYEEHGSPGCSDKTGADGSDRQDQGVCEGVCRDVTAKPDAAADRVEAEKQYDERNIIADDRMVQHAEG